MLAAVWHALEVENPDFFESYYTSFDDESIIDASNDLEPQIRVRERRVSFGSDTDSCTTDDTL